MKIEFFRKIEFRKTMLGLRLRIQLIFRVNDKEITEITEVAREIAEKINVEKEIKDVLIDKITKTLNDIRHDHKYYEASAEVAKDICIEYKDIKEIKDIIKEETKNTKKMVVKMIEGIQERLKEIRELENWIIKDYKLSEMEL